MTTTPSNLNSSWVRRDILMFWLTGLALWAMVSIANSLRGLLIQLLVALFLSFALHPIVEKLHARGWKRGVVTGLVMLGVLIFFVMFLIAMGSLVIGQMRQLVDDLPGYADQLKDWINSTFDTEIDPDAIAAQAQERLTSSLDDIANNAIGVGSAAFGFLFQLLTIGMFAFYLTADGARLRKNICSLLPADRQREVLRVWELAINKTGAFISSRVMLAIASAAFHSLVFTFIGLPSPLALGLWVGIVSQFVPVIGTYIAGVLPLLLALANEPITAIWVLATILLYQQVENYLLTPRITAQTLEMHPAIAFGGVIAGGAVLGPTGTLLALPIIATIQGFTSAYIERHAVVSSDLFYEAPAGDALAEQDAD